jgi:hypothetical protein
MNGSFALSLRVKEINPAPMDPLLCLFEKLIGRLAKK